MIIVFMIRQKDIVHHHADIWIIDC